MAIELLRVLRAPLHCCSRIFFVPNNVCFFHNLGALFLSRQVVLATTELEAPAAWTLWGAEAEDGPWRLADTYGAYGPGATQPPRASPADYKCEALPSSPALTAALGPSDAVQCIFSARTGSPGA